MDDQPHATRSWNDGAHVEWYLNRIGRLEARRAGEQMLVDVLPPNPQRALDLGCGDGRLAALLLQHRPSLTEVVAVDRSPPMLQRARERFADAKSIVRVRHTDLDAPLELASTSFDVVVSGFAIHHLEHDRKRALFAEIAALLTPGGLFANLEVVASASKGRHLEFLAAIGRDEDDPEDRLASVEAQCAWMRDAGLIDVDCLWRWRGFALLVGLAP
jgi:ubiquinone/menaquinone biosynthesis C-methylase UbiE